MMAVKRFSDTASHFRTRHASETMDVASYVVSMRHNSPFKKKVQVSLSTPGRHKRGAEVQLGSFLISELDGGGW